ncbi:MAG: hypothetical protein KJ592_03365 [Nanoarchaeota archaeon]|nr:hypothetical protein [Nanoarchaeota archaeon]
MVDGNKTKIVDEKEIETEKNMTPTSVSIESGKEKVEKVNADKKIAKVKKIEKKEIAIANGFSLRISPKQCVYVCKIIRGKSPEAAVARLQAVIDEKRPVPMAGLEVGHRKGQGLAGGRFPKNACKGVMDIVKQAGANAVVNGIDNPVISIAKSDRASAPFRNGGRKGKRCHIHIEVRSRQQVIGNRKQGGGKK